MWLIPACTRGSLRASSPATRCLSCRCVHTPHNFKSRKFTTPCHLSTAAQLHDPVHRHLGQQGLNRHLPRRLRRRARGRRAHAAHRAALLHGRAAVALRGGRRRHRVGAPRGTALPGVHGRRDRGRRQAAQARRPGGHRHQAARGAERGQARRCRRGAQGRPNAQDRRRDQGGRAAGRQDQGRDQEAHARRVGAAPHARR